MRRKSDEVKELQGTSRTDRKYDTLSGLTEIPRCPIKLQSRGKKLYKIICEHLIEVDGMLAPDTILVAMFCKTAELWFESCDRLNSLDDCVQYFKNGTSNVSAEFTAFQKLQKDLRDLASQLAIGINSRKTIPQFINNQLQFNFGDQWAGMPTIHDV